MVSIIEATVDITNNNIFGQAQVVAKGSAECSL